MIQTELPRPAGRGWLLDRYCLRQIAVAFLLAFGVVSSVLVLNFAFQAVRQGMMVGGEARSLFLTAFLALLSASSLVFPAAVLIATIQVASRMRSDGEFVAVQVAGGSWRQMARPFLVAGMASMIFTFFATHAVEPNARRALQRVLQTVAGRVFAQGGDTVRLDSSSVAQVLEGPDGVRRLVVSTRGQRGSDAILVGSPKQLELDPAGATVMVDLVEATAIEVDPEGAYHCTTADTLHAVFPVRLGGSAGVTALSDEALLRRVATRRQKGLRYGRDRLELEKRFSFPVACLAFSLLGFPLGYIRTRGNKAYGYLVSAAVILVYYLVVRAADTWADPHPVAARLLLWAPNGVAILVGVVWIRLKERGRR